MVVADAHLAGTASDREDVAARGLRAPEQLSHRRQRYGRARAGASGVERRPCLVERLAPLRDGRSGAVRANPGLDGAALERKAIRDEQRPRGLPRQGSLDPTRGPLGTNCPNECAVHTRDLLPRVVELELCAVEVEREHPAAVAEDVREVEDVADVPVRMV